MANPVSAWLCFATLLAVVVVLLGAYLLTAPASAVRTGRAFASSACR